MSEHRVGARGVGLGRSPWWLAPATLALTGFVCLPMVLLFAMSLAHRGPDGELQWGLTFENYAALAEPWMGEILLRSVGIAAATSLLCLALGFPFALLAAWAPPAQQRVLLAFVSLPLWTNLILRLYAFMILLRSDGVVNALLQATGLSASPLALLYTPGATALGMVYNFLPFAIMPLFAAASRIDKTWIDAARDLGADGWNIFFRVIWPLILPGSIAAVLLTFVPSMSLFVVADFLGGGRSMLLGNWIEHQFLAARHWPAGAAMAMVLLTGPLLMWSAGKRLLRATGLASNRLEDAWS